MGYDTATISYGMVISIYGNTYCHIANTIGHTAWICSSYILINPVMVLMSAVCKRLFGLISGSGTV
jgi:hypothetical protein